MFTAIDFETANSDRGSACAVGAVVVNGGRIRRKFYRLIRPRDRHFSNTRYHNIRWSDVCDQPTFRQIWPELSDFIGDSEFLVAHNAPFDRSVLKACCSAARIRAPQQEFRCTVQMARMAWRLPSARLPVVCEHLNIPLNHHHALSDAEACAKIAIRAMRKSPSCVN